MDRRDNAETLQKGQFVESVLRAAEVHTYRIELDTGQFLRAVVDQRGIDVVVAVIGPDGQKIIEVNSPNGSHGPEIVTLEAPVTGIYHLEIRAFDKQVAPGRYEVKIEQLLTAPQYRAYLDEQRAKQEAAITWLAEHSIRLRTVEAGHGFEDMQPLKAVIGGARVVALGEATHGTREFSQFKHRMVEFLVSEMGFTVFGIEATMPEAFDINEYLLTGRGDPQKALAGLYFWTWDTEEILEMILWMRRYNEDPRHERKVKFFGFDMQSPQRAVKVVLNYLRRVDASQADEIRRLLFILANPLTVQDFRYLPEQKKKEIADCIATLQTHFEEHKSGFVERTNLKEWAFARQHAQILAQFIEMEHSDFWSSGIRDRAMAENIQWIMEQEGPDTKIVVWAHNGHVTAIWPPGGSGEPMGGLLRKRFRLDLVVFGFTFHQGSFQALEAPIPSTRGLRTFTVGPTPAGSLDGVLAAAGLKMAAVDLRQVPKEGPVAEWFAVPRITRSLGAVYSEEFSDEYMQSEPVTRMYDALIFVEKTTAARALESGQRPASPRLAGPRNLKFEGPCPSVAVKSV